MHDVVVWRTKASHRTKGNSSYPDYFACNNTNHRDICIFVMHLSVH